MVSYSSSKVIITIFRERLTGSYIHYHLKYKNIRRIFCLFYECINEVKLDKKFFKKF